MNAKDIKKGDTYFLKKDFVIAGDKSSEVFVPTGAPIALYSKEKTVTGEVSQVTMHLTGSHIRIRVPVSKIDETIATFQEDAQRNAG